MYCIFRQNVQPMDEGYDGSRNRKRCKGWMQKLERGSHKGERGKQNILKLEGRGQGRKYIANRHETLK